MAPRTKKQPLPPTIPFDSIKIDVSGEKVIFQHNGKGVAVVGLPRGALKSASSVLLSNLHGSQLGGADV